MNATSLRLNVAKDDTKPTSGVEFGFFENGISISVGEANRDSLLKAAKKVLGLGITSVVFDGPWTAQEQLFFGMGFYSPKTPTHLEFSSDLSDEERTTLTQELAGIQLTRELVNETPEVMSPEYLANKVTDYFVNLAPNAVTVKKLTGTELVDNGYVGIYEVGRGSERPPVLLELDYNPSGKESVDVCLVGKGITYDSGGYSIKSSEGMLDMKCDMGGAATLAGALSILIQQGSQKRIKLFLCCAENLISGHAYKLGDILTYKNGTSVEIVNTDAEGRLVLADGLLAASESKPDVIIDAATLTGAAVMALGNDYNAVFTMNDDLASEYLTLADKQSEPHWRLPLTPAHAFKCPSPFADTANSRPQKGGGAGGASNAAGFLSRFVTQAENRWLHLDLAGAYNRNGSELMPEGGSALGVRTIAAFLKQL